MSDLLKGLEICFEHSSRGLCRKDRQSNYHQNLRIALKNYRWSLHYVFFWLQAPEKSAFYWWCDRQEKWQLGRSYLTVLYLQRYTIFHYSVWEYVPTSRQLLPGVLFSPISYDQHLQFQAILKYRESKNLPSKYTCHGIHQKYIFSSRQCKKHEIF